jgi:hypothetical protein
MKFPKELGNVEQMNIKYPTLLNLLFAIDKWG